MLVKTNHALHCLVAREKREQAEMWRLQSLLLSSVSRRFSTGLPLSAASVSVAQDGGKLHLNLDGEPERRYHGVWLRHNCRCAQCLPEYNQNIVHHSELIDLKITDAKLNEDSESVRVQWSAATGTHSCSFDLQWLKQFDYTTPAVRTKKQEEMTPLMTETLPGVEYKEVMSGDQGLYKLLRQVNFYGISLMTNIPEDGDIVEICSKIGPPQDHVYKLVFDVLATEEPTNAAYSFDRLLFHIDQGFFESPPGLQALHCLRFDESVEGGESILVDLFPIAEEIRRDHPREFKALTSIPYTIERIYEYPDTGKSACFLHSQPHISVDPSGKIIALNWCPQLHSPLQVPEDKVDEYYKAFILFSSMIENSPTKIIHRLKPGEAFIFNNRRMAHSRTAFKLNGGQRHLRGLYVNIDVFRSKFQLLANKLKTGENSKHVLNSSWTV